MHTEQCKSLDQRQTGCILLQTVSTALVMTLDASIFSAVIPNIYDCLMQPYVWTKFECVRINMSMC